MKRLLPWLLTAALLAGAWGIVEVTLPDDAASAPFVTSAAIGEPAAARDLAVTVTDVRAAREVTDTAGWSADGTWLIVDLDAAAVVSAQGATLGLAELRIGELTFSATDRGTTFWRQRLVPGVARSGSLAFELPADALSGPAVLRLGNPTGRADIPLDGVIEVPLDLDDVVLVPRAELNENGWAR